METATHPVQTHQTKAGSSRLPKKVTLQAYEVYCHVYSPQKALVTDGCRGGFSVGEIIAFLYAYSFPKNEWTQIVTEVFENMKNL